MRRVVDMVSEWSCKHPTLFTFLDWVISVVLVAITFAILLSIGSDSAQGSQPSIWVDNVNGAAVPNASGSPEAMSPVAALATCHTNGAASTTIQWASNGITLPAGNTCSGSDNCGVLYLNTTPGVRKFTEILSVTANTIVVEDSFNIALASAVDCAVGGRITQVETQLAIDMKPDHGSAQHGNNAGGWQVMIVNAGVNYTWTAGRVATATGNGAGFYGVPDGDVRPVVDCNFQPGSCLSLSGPDVVGIEFRNTSGVKTGTIGILLNNTGNQIIRDTIIGGDTAATAFETGVDWNNNYRVIAGSLIRNNVVGVDVTGINDVAYVLLGNVFQDNGDGVVLSGGSQMPALVAMGNVFWGNTTTGLTLNRPSFASYSTIIFNTFHDNGIAFLISSEHGLMNLLWASNLLTNNTTGVSYTGTAMNIERESAMVDYNCYGIGPVANGSNISGFILGPNTININPLYVNAVTGDFTPQVTNFTITSWPPGLNESFPGTATESMVGCGAIQPGGSGGGFNNVGI